MILQYHIGKLRKNCFGLSNQKLKRFIKNKALLPGIDPGLIG